MENIKITSSISKKTKNIILGISVSCLILALTFFIFLSCDVQNSFICKMDYHYRDKWDYITHTYSDCGYPNKTILILFIVIWAFSTCASIISFILYWLSSKMQITVTDKRVYGKTRFGRSVDLPIDSISAVSSSMFNGIAVATSSGKIKFLFIEKSNVVREEILKLLMDRQEKKEVKSEPIAPSNNVDEIKKYKELLDSGIITEDEFNQKKKQLLGL